MVCKKFFSYQVESPEEERERHRVLQQTVLERQQLRAARYLQKAQVQLLKRTRRREFNVGDAVLVNYHLREKKGKRFGKISYQNSGKVAEVSACGNYFRLRWTRCPPSGENEGELSKKRVRWDQLLLQTNQENEELLLQHYLMVDSYNTGDIRQQLELLEKVWRQRKKENGELEVLCTWNGRKKPSWRKVFEVAGTQQYELFVENNDYWEGIRQQNREKEDEEERYEIENIFYRNQKYVYVLWENYDEPGWVPILKRLTPRDL